MCQAYCSDCKVRRPGSLKTCLWLLTRPMAVFLPCSIALFLPCSLLCLHAYFLPTSSAGLLACFSACLYLRLPACLRTNKPDLGHCNFAPLVAGEHITPFLRWRKERAGEGHISSWGYQQGNSNSNDSHNHANSSKHSERVLQVSTPPHS